MATQIETSGGSPGYRKELGFWTVVFLATGAILGPAVGFTPASVLALAGPSGILSWVIAFVLMMAVAMCYVELGTMWPRAGGVAYYAARSNGPVVGVMNAWGSLVGYSLAVPSIVVAFVQYLSYWFPGLAGNAGGLSTAGIVASIVTLVVIGIINMMRIRFMGSINNVLTVVTIIGLLVIILALFGHFQPQNFSHFKGGFMAFGPTGLFLAISATIYGYGGFRQPIDYAEEVKDPGRTIPKAVLITMVITLVIYFLESVAFVGAVHWSGMGLKAGDWASINHLTYPFQTLAQGAGLPFIGLVAILVTLIASFKDGYIYFGGASRVGYSMGRYDGYLPKTFTRMTRAGIPLSSAILTFVISCIYIILLPSFASLFPLVASALLLSYSPGPLSMAVFRTRHPDEPRPYRLKGHKFLAPVAWVVSSLMIDWAGWSAVRVLIPSVFVGLLLLLFYVRRQKLTGEDWRLGIWFIVYQICIMGLSYLGSSNFGGKNILASPWDSIAMIVLSLIFYYWGYACGVRYKGHAVLDAEPTEAPH
ncbi:MAG: APC family permease [Alicyclobacillus sp.]|nr:APC family permease [Alicyclobacillus sp.]